MSGQLLEFRGQMIFVPAGVALHDVQQSILDDLVGFRNGKDGRNGRDGAKGRDGRDGSNGRDGIGTAGKDGKDGRHGRHGLDGKDGKDGKDGVGIEEINQPAEDIALFKLSDGKKFQIRLPRGKDGKDGRDSEGRTVVVNRFVESAVKDQESGAGTQKPPTYTTLLQGTSVVVLQQDHKLEKVRSVWVTSPDGEVVEVEVRVLGADLQIFSNVPLDGYTLHLE